MRTQSSILFCFAVSLLFVSCATQYTGTNAIIHFSSSPQQATVIMNGKTLGETPLTVKVKRRITPQKIEIQKTGYQTETIIPQMKPRLIAILSTTFVFVDILSGAILDYKENFYHTELKSMGQKTFSPDTSMNLKNNFYVITKTDTFYTHPFQSFEAKSLFSSYVDNFNFKLLTGTSKTLPVQDILKFKTLEIYNKAIGYLPFFLMTKLDYMIKQYIVVKLSEKKKKTIYMFMEELLANKEYHLVKTLVDVTAMNNAGNGTTASTYNKAIYYLYKEGIPVQKIAQHDLQDVLSKYFNNYKDLNKALADKYTFKKLEAFIYKDRQRADRYLDPF